jgi:hypothetical protein
MIKAGPEILRGSILREGLGKTDQDFHQTALDTQTFFIPDLPDNNIEEPFMIDPAPDDGQAGEVNPQDP